MGKRIRAFDWAETALGAPKQWPQGLKTLANLLLASRQPMFIAWAGIESGFITILSSLFLAISTQRRWELKAGRSGTRPGTCWTHVQSGLRGRIGLDRRFRARP